MLVPVADTRLNVEDRGSGFPLIVLHGGPGLDHHMFGDYLDPLTDSYRLVFVDQRAQGRSDRSESSTWTLERMAADVTGLAAAMTLDRYGVLGHSYGAFVALQHAVDHPGAAAATIVSSGIPSARFMADLNDKLAAFEPASLRDQVTASWEREKTVQTQAECEQLLKDQMPWHFADPFDKRIDEFFERTAGAIYSPEVLRHFANADYGGIEVEDRLGAVTHPVMVLTGRHDHTCTPEAAEEIAKTIPGAELMVFENAGHMTYVEQQDGYVAAVRSFLDRVV